MNPFLHHLPWRIAAFAGLMVGIVSWAGGTDTWVCLLRVGAAFSIFGLIGVGLRALLQPSQEMNPSTADRRKKRQNDITPPSDDQAANEETRLPPRGDD